MKNLLIFAKLPIIGLLTIFVSGCATAKNDIPNEVTGKKTYVNAKYGYQITYPDALSIQAIGFDPDPTDAPDVQILSFARGGHGNFEYSGMSIEFISPYYTESHASLYEVAQWLWDTNSKSEGNCKQTITPLKKTFIGADHLQAFRFDLEECLSIGSQGRVLGGKKTVTVFQVGDSTFMSLHNPDESEISEGILNSLESIDDN